MAARFLCAANLAAMYGIFYMVDVTTPGLEMSSGNGNPILLVFGPLAILWKAAVKLFIRAVGSR